MFVRYRLSPEEFHFKNITVRRKQCKCMKGLLPLPPFHPKSVPNLSQNIYFLPPFAKSFLGILFLPLYDECKKKYHVKLIHTHTPININMNINININIINK